MDEGVTEGGAADVAKATVRVGKRFARRVRTAAEADGAGRSGLAALIATHALCAAGDAMVAVALADTTFFSINADAARGKGCAGANAAQERASRGVRRSGAEGVSGRPSGTGRAVAPTRRGGQPSGRQ